MKVCSKCQKPKEKFWKDKRLRDGLQSQCSDCSSIYGKKFWKLNPTYCTKKSRMFRARNPEYSRAAAKIWYRKNPEKIRAMRLRQFWPNHTWEEALKQYNVLFAVQNGECAICKKRENVKHQSGTLNSLSVDHCHQTGRVRGLLCQRCNKAEGLLSLESAIALVNYKQKNGEIGS